MITDAETFFSTAQATTTTAYSTNTYDCGLTGPQSIGDGEPVRVRAQVTTSLVGGTNIQVQYVQSANADLSSHDVLASGETIVTADAVAGKVLFDQRVPANAKRYVGLRYVISGTYTAGAVDAGIVGVSDTDKFYPAESGI